MHMCDVGTVQYDSEDSKHYILRTLLQGNEDKQKWHGYHTG